MRLAVAAVVLLYVLHQDFWFWREARPLVFGFLPIGLFYHAAFTAGVVRRALAARRGRVAVASRRMIPALVVFAYLAVVLYIGIFAFRTSRSEQTPKIISSPAARSGRPCFCCRCSART